MTLAEISFKLLNLFEVVQICSYTANECVAYKLLKYLTLKQKKKMILTGKETRRLIYSSGMFARVFFFPIHCSLSITLTLAQSSKTLD